MLRDAGIAGNLATVRRLVAEAAHRSGRSPSEITLVAVSKTFDADSVREAALSGQLLFGENRVQEGVAKAEALADLPLEWHLIGHLQTNKARRAIASFDWIHAVDSVDLLDRLDRAAGDLSLRRQILVQVDLAGEETKFGAGEEAVGDLVRAAAAASHLDLRGLMIVPPYPDTPEDSRPWFRRLREVRDELVAGGIPGDKLAELSMGMTHDFQVAIEEGATIVRIGTAIFGARDYGAGEP